MDKLRWTRTSIWIQFSFSLVVSFGCSLYVGVVYYELGKLAVEKSKRGKSWWAICYLLDTVIDERSMRYVTF